MKQTLRNEYLAAMQIESWLPRVNLPFAAPSAIDTLPSGETKPILKDSKQSQYILPQPQLIITPVNTTPLLETLQEPLLNQPHFSLQLMQAGNCLLLIELVKKSSLKQEDPSYQLLRNILKASKLTDNPKLLGDIIHWPLFKQVNIPQGTKEAQEFVQSYITTIQDQLVNFKCLWLIGLTTIKIVTGLNEQYLFRSPIIQPIGQTLLIPSLESLIEQPQQKAILWQAIKQLIPLWQV